MEMGCGQYQQQQHWSSQSRYCWAAGGRQTAITAIRRWSQACGCTGCRALAVIWTREWGRGSGSLAPWRASPDTRCIPSSSADRREQLHYTRHPLSSLTLLSSSVFGGTLEVKNVLIFNVKKCAKILTLRKMYTCPPFQISKYATATEPDFAGGLRAC